MSNESSNYSPQSPKWSENFTIVLGFFFIGLGIYYHHHSNPQLLTRYTKEDGFLEWTTFFLYLSSFLLALFVYISRKIQSLHVSFTQNAALFVIGAVFLFGAMEEVSWFQRVLEIESGEFFKQHNRQAETNLHNMMVYGVNINRLIFGKIFFLILITHNILLPLLSLKKKTIKEKVEQWGLFLPPARLIWGYLAAVLFVELFISHSREKEHLEVLGSLFYFSYLFSVYILGSNLEAKSPLSIKINLENKKMWSIAFLFYLIIITLGSWMLGHFALKDFSI